MCDADAVITGIMEFKHHFGIIYVSAAKIVSEQQREETPQRNNVMVPDGRMICMIHCICI